LADTTLTVQDENYILNGAVVENNDGHKTNLAQEAFLDIQKVSHTYNTGTKALRDVSISIPKGQIFGLLGSNGSGKSTMMNCLAGILRPQVGVANLKCDDEVVNLFAHNQVSQYFSVVPQHDIYWPSMSILDHLKLMQKFNSLKHPINIDLLLEALQLEGLKDQPMHSLSGGVKRRASIAMAMSTAPPILALDEPSCGLGVTTKRFVHDAILRVLTDNTTLVLTTHDMEEVEALIDTCCIMNLGRVLKVGSVS
jgi:ABC-type multidrug transport system ATPase subunit